MRRYFVAFLLIISVFHCHSLTLKDTQALINRGRNYLIDGAEYTDSAQMCFSKVLNSYHRGLTEEQMYHCAVAAVNLSSLYFHYVGDYKSAYEALVKASEISENINRPLIAAQIAMNFANIYAIFSQQVESPEFNELSIDEYHKAFRLASENESWLQTIVTFCNFTSEVQKPGYVRQFTDEIKKFGTLPISPDNPDFSYAKIRYKSTLALLEGDTISAISYLKTQLGSSYDTPNRIIYTHQDLRSISYLYYQTHRLDSALYYTAELLKLGNKENNLEAVSDAYCLMERIYRQKGDLDAARMMHAKFLVSQDSILNFQNLGTIDNLKFIYDLAAERQKASILLAESYRQKKLRELVIFFSGLLLAITIPLLIVIANRHRRLQASYQDLYNQRQQIIEQEDRNRKLRKEHFEAGTIDESDESGVGRNPDALMVLSILDKSEEVFESDFSLERLSELTNIRPRTLSMIFNEQLHTTFRDLINQYRVREACKKLSDIANYGQYTIEAISQSVGYKSRTSLITAFKKETGLTPSEYQRIARNRNI